MRNTGQHLMLGFGFRKILAHFLEELSSINFKEGCTRTGMILGHLFLLELGSILEERCFFFN